MRKYDREEGLAFFSKFWDTMETEWFKVELLQDYSGEDDGPSLQAWKVGDRDESMRILREDMMPEMDDWKEMNQKKAHVDRIRLHVIERPLTPYLEWEIELYKLSNIPVMGEKVYLVEADKVRGLDLPKGDFMIFDQKMVTNNTYSPEGKVTHVDVYEEGEDINRFLYLREELMGEMQSVA